MTWPALPADALVGESGTRTVVVRMGSGQVLEVNEPTAFVLAHRDLFTDLDDAVSKLTATAGIDHSTLRGQLHLLEEMLNDSSEARPTQSRRAAASRRDRRPGDIPARLSRTFRIDALGLCASVISHDDDLTEVLAPLLAAHPHCDDASERIDVWRTRAGIEVAINGRRVSSEASVSMAVQSVVGLLTAMAIDANPDSVLVHAAAVELDGSGLVLAGPSGAGKSSTTVELLVGGATYLSDELVQLDTTQGSVVGFPRAIGLEGPVRQRHPELRPDWCHDSPVDLRWTLAPHAVGEVRHSAQLDGIVYLERMRDGPSETTRLSWPAALARLLPVMYHREVLTTDRLDRLIAMLEAVPCYHLRHRGANDAASLVRSLTADAVVKR